MRHLTRSAVAACVFVPMMIAQQAVAPVEILVTGRVCDPAGAPIEGAELTAIGWDHAEVQAALDKPQHVTGADGSFQVKVRRNHRLLTTAEGRLSLAVPISTDDKELWLGDVVLPPGTTWFGRVRGADGKPIAGATVRASDPSLLHDDQIGPQFQIFGTTRTGEDGIYRIEGLPANALALEFEADGWLPHRIPLADRSTPTAVELQPGVWCRGRVEPKVSSGSVFAYVSDGAVFRGELAADGTFGVCVPDVVSYRVYGYSQDLPAGRCWSPILTGAQDQVVLGTDDDERDALLVHVVDKETRQPVAEFAIHANWNFGHGLRAGHLYDKDPMRGTRGRDGVTRLSPPRNWKEGHGILMLRAPGHGEAFFVIDKPKELPNREPIVIALPAERQLSGTVSGADGKPLAGAEVWPVPIAANSSLSYGYKPSNLVRTDGEGRFTLTGLGPRRYAIQAFAEGHHVPRAVELDLEQAPAPVQIQLEARKTVQVRWRNRPAGPGWYCTVANLSHTPGGAANWSNGKRVAWGAIDPNRPLVLPDLGAGSKRYVVRAAHGRWANPLLFEVTGQDPIDLAALRPAILRGKVVLPETLTGLVAIDVVPQDERASLVHRLRASIEPDGSYELELAPGSYQLMLESLSDGQECWLADDKITLDADQTIRCDLAPEVGCLRIELAPHRDGAPLRSRYARLALPGPGKNINHAHVQAQPVIVVPARAGLCKVTLHSSTHTLEIEQRYENQELVTGEVKVEAGRVAVLKLQEPPPAPPPPANGAK